MAKRPVDRTQADTRSSPIGKPKGDAGQGREISPMPDDHVVVGVIGAAHGLRGEVRLKSYTEDPMSIGDYGPLRLHDGRSVTVKPLRYLRDDLIIAKLSGIDDRTQAETLTGLHLSLARARLPALADDDEFYHADLVGLKVVDQAGDVLGHIVGLFNHGAGDMLEIRLTKPAPTDFLPFTKEFVPKIDIKSGFVEVVLPKDFGKPAGPPPQGTKRSPSTKLLGERKAKEPDAS
jgi:16S rRNA processing protein RimM